MDSAKERKLRELVKRGDAAKSLKEFLAEFYEVEKEKVIVDLLQSARDPAIVRADMRAANRLVDYISAVILKGDIAEKKLKEET